MASQIAQNTLELRMEKQSSPRESLVGIRSIENKKFPTARTNNKPRSNLVDGSNEVKINIPSKIAKR